jgi:AmiR/NasT family two-component response regulator
LLGVSGFLRRISHDRVAGTRPGAMHSETMIRLRERHKAPIVFVMGLTQEELRERMNHASPAAILLKPYTQEDLRHVLRLASGV